MPVDLPIDLVSTLGLEDSEIGRDQVERLRKALNEFVCFDIGDDHGGLFALDKLLTVVAIGALNRDGNLGSFFESLASALHYLSEQDAAPWALVEAVLELGAKFYPPGSRTDSAEACYPFGAAQKITYPIQVVLVDKETGESFRAALHEEAVEVGGVLRDRDDYFYVRPKGGWRYHVVTLDKAEDPA